jgi:hypothetical protein
MTLEIPDPPQWRDCASCGQPLVPLFSMRLGSWIAVVATGRDSFKLHACRHAQDPVVWREVREPSPPSSAYVEARQQYAPKIQNRSEKGNGS